MGNKIDNDELVAGEQILVKGKVTFSRLTALISGAELEKRNEEAARRANALGKKSYPRPPHTTITLADAVVLAADPQNPTISERYVNQNFYQSKSGQNAGKTMYSIDSISPSLPTVLEMDPDQPGAYRQLILEGDLDTNMEVILFLEVYQSKNMNKGVGLQQVILQEPVRYFQSAGASSAALAARGIIVNGPISNVPAEAAPAPAQNQAPSYDGYGAPAAGDPFGLPANTQIGAGGYPAPAPGAQFQQQAPVQPQAAPAFQQAPAQPQAPVQPQAPAAPAAAQQETPEQQIQRLQAQLRESQNAAAASAAPAGASAFDGAPAGSPSPWDVPTAAPAFQG